MKDIKVPTNDDAEIVQVSAIVRGQCGHEWDFDITNGTFPDGWYVCRRCTSSKNRDAYRYTKVLVKYPYLNSGMQKIR